MRINGIDYDRRSEVLLAVGIDPFGSDDTAFGAEVYCNQHSRVHLTGWCAVSNVEKFFTDETRPARPSTQDAP
jgi:hypothetical protein